MKSLARAISALLVYIVFCNTGLGQRIVPQDQTYTDKDSVLVSWDKMGASSYILTVNDGITVRDIILTDTAYWVKGYQPFDTLSVKVSAWSAGGLVYQKGISIFTANFASHPRLCLWLDPSTVDTVAGGSVSQWRDRSSRGFVFTQPTASFRPLYKTYNGVGAVNFTGDFLFSPFYEYIDSMKSTYTMMRHNGVTGSYNMILSKKYSGTGIYTLAKYNGKYQNYVGSTSFATTILMGDDWQISSYRFVPTNKFVTERNFTETHTQTVTTFTGGNTSNLTIGRNSDPTNTSTNYYFGGDISEIIIFSESLGTAQNIFVKKYLSAKYSPRAGNQYISILDRFCDTTLSVPSVYRSYLWSTGSTTASTQVSFSGDYTVTVENLYGEKSVDTVRVRYPHIALRDTSFCSFDSVLLTTGLDPALFDFSWSNGKTAPEIWVKSAGYYSVLVKDKFGCSRLSETIEVSENKFPMVNLFPADTSLCVNNAIHPYLQYAEGNAYLWDNGHTGASKIVLAGGKHYLTVTENNRCKAVDSVDISITGNAPIVNFASDTACFGLNTSFTNKTFSADPVASYAWDFAGDGTSGLQHPAHRFSSAGTKNIRLTVSTTTGCIESVLKNTIVGEIPQTDFTVINGDFACTSKNIALVNTSATLSDQITTQTWNFGNGNFSLATLPAYTYPLPGAYSIRLTNTTEHKCQSSKELPVTVMLSSGIPCVPSLLFPLSDTALLKQTQRLKWGNVCNSYQLAVHISDKPDFSSLVLDTIVAPKSTSLDVSLPFGSYWWRVYAIGTCKDTTVSVVERFTIFKPELMEGMKLWLDAGQGVQTDEYGNVSQWYDAAGNSKHATQPFVEQRPALIDKGLNNLPVIRFDGINDMLVGQNLYADEHNMSIFVVHKYDGNRLANVQTLLAQQSSGGTKYRLYTNAKTNFTTLFGVGTGALGVIAAGSDYFTLTSVVSSAQTSIFSNGMPNASATLGNITGLESEFVIGAHLSNNITQVFSGDIAEIIIFNRALSPEERKKIDTYLLSKYQPEPVELGDDREIPYRLCPEILQLADGYKQYAWNTGDSASNISTREPGLYSVETISWFGIRQADSLSIFRPRFVCNDTAVCLSGAINIKPGLSKDYTYLWSTGSTEPTLSVAQSGEYSLTITDTTGCTRTFEDFSVSIDSFPVQASLGMDNVTLCKDAHITLSTGADEAVLYQWSDGSTEAHYTVTKSETVTVTVTDQWLCKLLDTVQVRLQGHPIGTGFVVENTCFQDISSFTSTSEPYDSIAKLQWTIDGISVSQAPKFSQKIEQQGNRAVKLTSLSLSGCVHEAVDTIFIKPKPSALYTIAEACVNNAYRYINASKAGANSSLTSAEWNINNEASYSADTVFHQFASAGDKLIKLKVTNAHGCSDSTTASQKAVLSYFAPASFALIAPAANAVIMDSAVLFSWESSLNAYKYLLELSKTADFASIDYTDSSYSTSLIVPVGESGEYYWRVVAANICGNKTVSTASRLERINLNTHPSVAMWLKADAGITLTEDSTVSAWADQSAKKTNVIQTLAASQPSVKADAINGKPAVSFDGTSDQLRTAANFSLSNVNMSVFVVSKFNESKASNLNTIMTHRTSTGAKFSLFATPNSGNSLQYGNFPPDIEPINAGSYGMGKFKISALVAKADSTHIYTNSELSARGKSVVPTGTDNLLLVGGFATNLLSYGFSGEIAEIIIFNTAVSSTLREQIENYLFNKYSTPLELGADIAYSLCDTVISAPDVYDSYLWNTKLTGKNASITGPGTYSLTVTDQLGMTWKDSVQVSRPFIHNLKDTLFCAGDAVLWDLQMGYAYRFLWSDGSTDSVLSVSSGQTVFAKVTDSLGCTAYSDTVMFALDSFPVISTIGNDRSLCAGEYIFFENPVQQADSYQWSSGSKQIYDIADKSGQYAVTATNANGCKFEDAIEVTIKGIAPSIGVNIPDICQNAKTALNANITTQAGDPVKSVEWKFGQMPLLNGNAVEVSLAKAEKTPMTVTALTENGCKASYYSELTVKTNPSSSIAVSFGKTHCSNSPVSFDAVPVSAASVASYSWSFGETGKSVTHAFISEGKTAISLTATNNNGCQWIEYDSITVLSSFPSPQPASLLSPVADAALLDTVILFEWTEDTNAKYYALTVSGADGAVLKADSLTSATYLLKVKTNQKYTWDVTSVGYCGDTAVSAASSFDKTDIDILAPTLWLDASALQLQAGQYVTKWGKPTTEQVSQSNVQISPTYIKSGTAINGRNSVYFDGTEYLTGSTDFGIEQMATLTALVRIDSTTKQGMILSKAYAGEGAFSISVAANTNRLSFYVDGATVTTAKGFYGWVLLTVQLKKDSVYVYADNKIVLASKTSKDNKGINTYPFTVGKSSQSATYFFKGAVAEVLSFGRVLSTKERSVVEQYLTAKYLPSMEIPGSIEATGFYPVTVNAPSSFRNYAWNNGSAKRDITVNASGTYILSAATFTGDTLTDTCIVHYPYVHQINDTAMCIGKSVVWDLGLVGDYQYDWFKNDEPISETSNKLTINNAGVYHVNVTDAKAYTWTSKKVTVSVIDLAGSLDLGTDKNMCKNALFEPARKPDNIKAYKWDNGTVMPYNYATVSKKYYLSVTDAYGCLVADSIYLTISGEAPTASLNIPDLCENTESRFAPSIIGSVGVAKYNWTIDGVNYTADTVKALFKPTAALPLRVSLESADNCKAVLFDTISVLPVVAKSIEVFPDTVVCTGRALTAWTQADHIASYYWTDSKGDNNATDAVFHPVFPVAGSYSIQCSSTLLNGCTVEASRTLTVADAIPDAEAPQLLHPLRDMRIFDKIVDFRWSEDKAAFYHLEVSDDSLFANIIVKIDSLQSQYVEVELTKDTVYFWRIAAHSFCGEIVTSETFRFERFSISAFKPVVWIDASQLNMQDKSAVAAWGEPSTHTFAQPLATRQPLYHGQTAAIGGMPSVEFIGKSYMSSDTLLPLDSMQTVIGLVENSKLANYEMIISKNYTGEGCFTLAKNTGNTQFRFYVDNGNLQNKTLHSGWSLVCFTIGKDTVYSYFDNAVDTKFRLVKDFKGRNASPITIGKNSAADTYHFNGKIAELMVLPRGITSKEYQLLATYFTNKYQPAFDIPDTLRMAGFKSETIAAPSGFRDYMWSNGSADSAISVAEDGLYKLVVTDYFGRIIADSTVVIAPKIGNLEDSVLCIGDSTVWDSQLESPFTFVWYKDGEQLLSDAPALTISEAGLYQLQAIDLFGYSRWSDIRKVEVRDIAQMLELGSDTSICQNAFFAPIRIPDQLSLLEWNDGSTADKLKITASGQYRLSVTDIHGCAATDSIILTIDGLAADVSIVPAPVCEDTEIDFNSFIPSFEQSGVTSYQWQIGDSLLPHEVSVFAFKESGKADISITTYTDSGCRNTAQNTLTVLDVPHFDFLIFPSSINCIYQQFTLGISNTDTMDIIGYDWYNDVTDFAESGRLYQPVFGEESDPRVGLTVNYSNGCSYSHSTDLRVLNTTDESATEPILMSPQHNSYVYADSITVLWQDNGAAYYTVVVSADSIRNTVIETVDSLQADHYTFRGIRERDMYISVQAHFLCGTERWSASSRVSKYELHSANTALWLDAGQLKLADAAPVLSWGAGGNFLAQPAATLAPHYVESVAEIADKPAVSISSKQYLEGMAQLPLDSIRTVFMLAQIPSAGSYQMILSKNHTGEGSFTIAKNNTDSKIRIYADGNNKLSTKAYTGWSLVCVRIIGTKAQLFVNGVLDSEYDYAKDMLGLAAAPLTLGKQGGANAYHYTGQVAEVLVMKTALSDEELGVVTNYFRDKYTADLQLPDSINVGYGLCAVSVTPNTLFQQYKWSTGETSSSIQANKSGYYTLTATDFMGTSYVDSCYVRFAPMPKLSDTAFCFQSAIVLDADMGQGYSYRWSHGAVQPQVSVDSSGEYSVTISDTLGCSAAVGPIRVDIDFFTQEASLGNDRSFCKGNRLGLETRGKSVTEYLWHDGSVEPTIVLAETGTVSLWAKNSRGCEMRDTIKVTIAGEVPTAAFDIAGHCSGQVSVFTSQAQTDDVPIQNYEWLINNVSSTGKDTEQTFDQPGVYAVKHIVSKADGCTDSSAASVTIHPTPTADFLPVQGCQGQTIPFRPVNVTHPDNISAYEWRFADGITEATQIEYLFDTAGTYEILLSVTSDQLCVSTRTQSVEIKRSAQPRFIHSPACKGEGAVFFNKTAIDAINPVIEGKWIVNGTEFYSTGNFEYQFADAGTYTIGLSLKTVNGCTGTGSQEIVVTEPPRAFVRAADACQGGTITLYCDSVQPRNIGHSLKWVIEDSVYTDSVIHIDAARQGHYTAKFSATTQYGCSFYDTVAAEVFARPSAQFKFRDTAQILPFSLHIDNMSEGADSSIWIFNQEDTVFAQVPQWTVYDTSRLMLTHIAVNANNCRDSISLTTGFAAGFRHLTALNVFAYHQDGFDRAIMAVSNSGTAAISRITFFIEIDNTHYVKEVWTGDLSRGDTLQYLFNANFKDEWRQARKICMYAQIDGPIAQQTELLCTSLADGFGLLPIYPVPSHTAVYIDYSVPATGSVRFDIESATGMRVASWERSANTGFNTETVDITPLSAGAYTLSLSYGGVVRREQFIKER